MLSPSIGIVRFYVRNKCSLFNSFIERRNNKTEVLKRVCFRIADVLVGKLCAVIRLNRLNPKREHLLQHFQKLHGVFRCILSVRGSIADMDSR